MAGDPKNDAWYRLDRNGGADAPDEPGVQVTDDPGAWDRNLLLRRFGPFVAMGLLGFLTLPLTDQEPRVAPLVAAGVIVLILVAAVAVVPWQRLPRWATLVPPFAALVVIALLRHGEGGAVSGYGVLVFIPVLWLALYGTRREVYLVLGAVAVLFVAPILLYGDPEYPATEWRRAILVVAMAAFVALVTQGLVSNVRRRAAESEENARLDRQREAYLRAVTDNAAEGIFALDTEGRTRFMNPSAAAMLGYAVDELVGQPLHDVIHHSHADGTPYLVEHCPTLTTLRTGRQTFREDEVYWRKDGTSFPVEYRTKAILDGGEVVGSVTTFSDITERREVQRLKDEFVSVVSHELRTPLTSIRGSLGLLQGGVVGELPAEATDMLGIAIENSDRLVRLINDILDAERIESGQVAMDREAVELAGLMEHTGELLGANAQEAGVTLTVEPLEARIFADPDRVIQTLVNLIGNAIKFSPPNTTVRVNGSRDGFRARVTVTDQGPGIPPEQRQRIFDRFTQLDSSSTRAQAGSGLGLAIARSIVESHGGRIWVEPGPGGVGSQFGFELPLAPVSAPARVD